MTKLQPKRSRFVQLISGLVMCFGMALSLHWFYFPNATDRPPIWLVLAAFIVGAAGLLPVQLEIAFKIARDLVPSFGDRRRGEERRDPETERRVDVEAAAAWPADQERRLGGERRELGDSI